MKKDLMEILACPVCKGELELKVEEEESEEVISGRSTVRPATSPIR